jgi:hypothetical protein
MKFKIEDLKEGNLKYWIKRSGKDGIFSMQSMILKKKGDYYYTVPTDSVSFMTKAQADKVIGLNLINTGE